MRFGTYVFITLLLCLCFNAFTHALPVESKSKKTTKLEKRFCIFRCNSSSSSKASSSKATSAKKTSSKATSAKKTSSKATSSKATSAKATSSKASSSKASPTSGTNKSTDQVAQDVLSGKYGNGQERKEKLEAEGYNYSEVQSKVNQLVSSSSSKATSSKAASSSKPTSSKAASSSKPTSSKAASSKPASSSKPTSSKPASTSKPTSSKPASSSKPTSSKPVSSSKPTSSKPPSTSKPTSSKATSSKASPTPGTKKTTDQIAQDVLDGKYGNGQERKEKLEAEGYNYSEVQSKVNQLVSGGSNTGGSTTGGSTSGGSTSGSSTSGGSTSGGSTSGGSTNGGSSKPTSKKSVEEIAQDVLDGKYGTGQERKEKLEAEGYNYSEVQKKVNQLVSGGSNTGGSTTGGSTSGGSTTGGSTSGGSTTGGSTSGGSTTGGSTSGGSTTGGSTTGSSNNGGSTSTTPKKSVEEIAQDVIDGKYGSGQERKEKLEAEGYNYSEVQKKVNQLVSGGSNTGGSTTGGSTSGGSTTGGSTSGGSTSGGSTTGGSNNGGSTSTTPKKSIEEIAQDVIDGKYGSGQERKEKLEAEGYNYSEVQKKVNQLVSGGSNTGGSTTGGSTTGGSTTGGSNTGGSTTGGSNQSTTLDKIEQSITDNWNKEYNYDTGYRCDNWVEEVIDDAGLKSSDYLKAGKAASKTVQNHIDDLTKNGVEGVDYTKTLPTEDGAYVVFMGDGKKNGVHVGEHAAILIVKNGVKTMYDNSSDNGGTPVYKTDKDGNTLYKTDKDGNSVPIVSYYDQGVAKVEVTGKNNDKQLNGWLYNSYYYQKIE
ncbi:hypothetical protein BCR32DRAFT_325061 [Anaeromyces robustus]|uniref:Cpl-7 lysozyme C-terminal domain-containing protein n=1 Tax=Anaeromyces robustus TaxID=1754192 RepID=A0A1Y1XKS2_9FUNG|nr:hypothetical protein BCR32DRAFT_325061 [Anaeromyces robustus]|eukprot:ORX86305.1 hypothetical protein BCR32DRAFT_325061 [Anaeromyces robustus]